MTGNKEASRACQRIVCPQCGNDTDFLEVASGVILTNRYVQNEDCSFTQQEGDSRILGDVRFFCNECQTDLSAYHQRFLDMLF